MPSLVLGKMVVVMTADAAPFHQAMDRASAQLQQTGRSFTPLRQAMQSSGQASLGLEGNFKATLTSLSQLTSATGVAGGAFGRLGGSLASLAATGFNPLALAIGATGVLVGMLVEQHRDATEEAAKQADEEKRITEEILRRAREERQLRTGKSSETLSELDLQKKLSELQNGMARKQEQIVARARELFRLGNPNNQPVDRFSSVKVSPQMDDQSLLATLKDTPSKEVENRIRALLGELQELSNQADLTQRQLGSIGGKSEVEGAAKIDKEVKSREKLLQGVLLEAQAKARLAGVTDDAKRAELEMYDAVNRLARSLGELTPAEEGLLDLILQANLAALGAARAVKAQESLVDSTKRLQDARREQADRRRAEGSAESEEIAQALEYRMDLEQRMVDALREMGETDADRAVRQARAKYSELVHEAQAFGFDVTGIEAGVAAAVEKIRTEAAVKDQERKRREEEEAKRRAYEATMKGDDLAAGFAAQVEKIQEDMGGIGALGAQIADQGTRGLSQGLAGALREIATGAASAGEAFRSFASSFLLDMSQMILEAMIFRAIMSGLGMATGGAAAAPAAAATSIPGAAVGGTFRAVGYGGMDSMVAALRVTPGEVIRVGPPGDGAGEGRPIRVHTTVKTEWNPDAPLVLGSRRAKTSLVAQATQRSGYRGREMAP